MVRAGAAGIEQRAGAGGLCAVRMRETGSGDEKTRKGGDGRFLCGESGGDTVKTKLW